MLADQRDGPPLGGAYPTSKWLLGKIIADRRTMPPLSGQGRILVGMYDLLTLERLPAYDDDGERLANDAIPLSVKP